MDKRTVKKYLAMDEQDYLKAQENVPERVKKLAPYEDFVRERIESCFDASSTQVHDWLKECHPDFMNVNEKTVYNFVLYVREKYKLLKEFSSRDYCQVAELPYGKQAQVDFGEFIMGAMENQRRKVYFFALVLARSRYKYVFFCEHPFTSATAIDAHEKAFAFIGGYPEEIVYDQDKVLLVDENKGNLVLTDAFRSYHSSRKFGLHFCRKSDPQSKGKIENVIKYVKYNFLRGRIFYDIHTLNHQSIEWLERTANAKVHASTQQIPYQQWLIEKTLLKHLREPFLIHQGACSYKVRKDNTVSFKGNFYTLPVGTYRGSDSVVFLLQENDLLIIHNNDKREIARHRISSIKGKLIFNNNHYRERSLKIKELMELLARNFSDPQGALEYLEKIREQNPRYVRDQVKIIHAVCEKYTIAQRDQALHYCMENQIFKASDFEPVLLALAEQKLFAPSKDKAGLIENEKYRVIPQKSNLSDYNQLLN
jgi:transposase